MPSPSRADKLLGKAALHRSGQPIPASGQRPAAAREPAIIQRVVEHGGGSIGGGNAASLIRAAGEKVLIAPPARLDSPEWIKAQLFSGAEVTAHRMPVSGSPAKHNLRYRRHGRIRSSYVNMEFSRYKVIELKCTLSFQLCTYWIPETQQYLFVNTGQKYQGFINLTIGFSEGPGNPISHQLLKTCTFELKSRLLLNDAKQDTQVAEIAWKSSKLMAIPGASESVVRGYLELDAQTYALTATDETSKKLLTLTRDSA